MDYFDVLFSKYLSNLSGGGGGSSVTVEPLSVTENGTYTAETGKAYSPVTVNTPQLATIRLTLMNATSDITLDVTSWACNLYATDGTNIMMAGDDPDVLPFGGETIERVLILDQPAEHGYVSALSLVNNAMVNVSRLDYAINCYLDGTDIVIDDPTKDASCEIVYLSI